MEIEVGDYIRFDDGKIIKVIKEEVDYYNYLIKDVFETQNTHSIKKYSKNIMDLIEEGDYVNGEYVAVIEKDKEGNITDICYEEENEGQLYSIGDIKSIVTKEQFSQMEYKLEE